MGLNRRITDPDEALRAVDDNLEQLRRERRVARGGDVATRVVVAIVVLGLAAWLVMIWLNAHHITPSWGH